jgi:RNA-directed DNA polymerase
MNRLLKGWRNTKRGEQFDAHIVNYADDFVILSRGKAAEALNWTRQVVTRMGVTLNEAKTSIKQARHRVRHFLRRRRQVPSRPGFRSLPAIALRPAFLSK